MTIKENIKRLTGSADDIIEKVLSDRQIRRAIASRDILWFFGLYFSDYIKYQTADFQIEILRLLQNEENKMLAIIAFRDSGKSTFCSLVLVIWSIIGTHQKKYILIVCQTEDRAQQALKNIRAKLEEMGMLLSDFGAFYENEEWNNNTLVVPKYGSRIMAVSISESIRGVRHREHRPGLIVCDDIEDVQSSRMKESRDKLWKFLNSELIPAGDKDARYIFIGNRVHKDSVMERLKIAIDEGRLNGAYREYPIAVNNRTTWPGKYPSMKEVEQLRRSNASEIDFLREYYLMIVPEGDQIIFPEDIIRYDENEINSRNDFRLYLIAIDPAVSLRHTADKTAIIVAKVYGYGDKFKIYIQKYPVNKRLTFPEIIDEVKRIVSSFGKNLTYKIFVEGGSVQKGLAQLLQKEELHAEEVNVQGQDKRTRLSMTRYLLQKWVSFPKTGTEELEIQMLGFGVERYDDLVDALTLLVIQAVNNYKSKGVGSFSMISDPEPIYRNFGGEMVDVSKPFTAGLLDKKF